MVKRFVSAIILAAAFGLSACTAVSVATTVVGAGVGVASTGVRVGVGATARAADLIIPDGDTCDEDDREDEAAEDEDCAELE